MGISKETVGNPPAQAHNPGAFSYLRKLKPSGRFFFRGDEILLRRAFLKPYVKAVGAAHPPTCLLKADKHKFVEASNAGARGQRWEKEMEAMQRA